MVEFPKDNRFIIPENIDGTTTIKNMIHSFNLSSTNIENRGPINT